MLTTDCAVPDSPHRRGRRSSTPITELGLCIQRHLDCLGKTRAELARRLHVSPSTVGRLLNGDTRIVQHVSVENICDALELNEIDRRTFLNLVGVASATGFALATGAKPARTTEKHIDLDLADDHMNALQRLLDKGDTQYVMESARQWYDRLLVEPSKDIRYGALQIRYGILLGAAQEFVVPWYRRGYEAIRTYDSIENDVIVRFDLKTFRQEYAYMISHRAPLLREMGHYEESAAQYEDGIYWVKTVHDPQLRANLFRSRIHASAILGNELRWARELEEARKDALFLFTNHHNEVFGLLDYVEGEGFKRLAYTTHVNMSVREREAYASRALQSFIHARPRLQAYTDSHHMLMRVSEAQCLVWIDPQHAICEVELLREVAEQHYPALVEKIERVILFARRRLVARRSDFPLLFDLDAKTIKMAK